MVALYIILGIVLLIAVLLICPITVRFSYAGKFSAKIKYLFISIKIPDNSKKPKKNNKENNKENKLQIKEYAKKHGTADTVREICEIIKILYSRTMWLFKKLIFEKLFVDIKICGSNAAYTAIEYGGVCAAVYPVVSFISTNAKTDIKAVNISPDFNEGNKSSAELSGTVKCRAIYALVTLVSVIKILTERELIKLKAQPNNKSRRVQNNGRK